MYSPLIPSQDKDYLCGQCVLIYTTNLNDLAISTNDRTIYYEIMQWYQSKTQREFKEKKPKSNFVQYQGILEGARKPHVFGDFLWIITIIDKFLEIGCTLSGLTQLPTHQTSQLVFITNKASPNERNENFMKTQNINQYRKTM